MKFYFPALLSLFAVVGTARGSTYSTNFNSLVDFGPNGTDINGKDGWVSSDTTDQFSQISTSNVNPANVALQSRLMDLGDASVVDTLPSGSSVTLSHPYIGATVGATTLNFDFALIDSNNDSGFLNRDIFGVSFSNGGSNVFSVTLVPIIGQPTDPDAQVDNWNLYCKIGTGATIPLNLSVSELSQYDFNLVFSQNGINPLLTDFSLTITSISNSLTDGKTGQQLQALIPGQSLDPNTSIDAFNVSWTKQGANQFGSNHLYLDNLSVVPEPTSAILLCLTGIGFASRRKRA